MKKLLFLLLFSSIAYSQVYEKTTAVGLDSSVTKPSAIAKYGWVYRGTDNHLYWKTLNGTRMLDSSTSITIDSTNWQKYPDTLTWDATKKNLKDSTASLRTDLYRKDTHITDSTNARNYSDSRYNKKLVVRESDGSPRATQVDSLSLNKNNLTVTDSANGKIAINTIQDIGTTASPTFANANLTSTLKLFNGAPYATINYDGVDNVVFDKEITVGANIHMLNGLDNLQLVWNGGSSNTQTYQAKSGIFPLQQTTFTPTSGRLAYWKDGYIRDTNITFQDLGTGASPTFADIHIDGGELFNPNHANGLGYWDNSGIIGHITNVAAGQIPISRGAGDNPVIFSSKIFLYPSDSAFIVTSSIKNKNVASYVQQGDTSAFVSDFTTGTGKPQMRIKDPTGVTTLYIDSTGQINGSEVANGDLTLQGTTNATRTTSYVNLQPNGGFVGIGTATPVDFFTIYKTNSPIMHFQNTGSGTASTDGFLFEFGVGGGSAVDAQLWNFENGYVRIGSNNTERMRVLAGGGIDIYTNVSKVTNIASEGTFGVPLIVDTVARTGQTAAIIATNFSNAGVAGLYEITAYALCTTASGSGSPTLDVTISWTDAVGATTNKIINGLSLSATGRSYSSQPVQLSSGNITWKCDINAASGSPVYAIYLTAKRVN